MITWLVGGSRRLWRRASKTTFSLCSHACSRGRVVYERRIQISVEDLWRSFLRKCSRLSSVNYICRILHLRFLTGFWIRQVWAGKKIIHRNIYIELWHCLCLTIDSRYNLSINRRIISSLAYGGAKFCAKFLHSGSYSGLLGDSSKTEW